MERITSRPSMIGMARTIHAGKKRFPVTILFGYGRPCIVYGRGGLTPIDSPERFGQWETPRQQCAYLRAFVANWDDGEE